MKKTTRKILSVILAVLMVMSSVWMGLGVVGFAASEYELEANGTVKITPTEKTTYIKIEPEETGTYILEYWLYSFRYDLYFLDSNKEVICSLDNFNDYSTLEMTGGEAYYLGVDIDDLENSYAMTFNLYYPNEVINENETIEFYTIPPFVSAPATYVAFVPENSGYFEIKYNAAAEIDANLCDANKNHQKCIGYYSAADQLVWYLVGGKTYYIEFIARDNSVVKTEMSIIPYDNGIVSGGSKEMTLYGSMTEKLMFITENPGTYRFYSTTSTDDCSARLIDEYGDTIAYSTSLEGIGFEIVCEVYANQTCFLEVWNNCPSYDDEVRSFEVKAECLYEFCMHENAVIVEGKEATCIEDGYSAGEYCPDCDTWLVAQDTITGTHSFENNGEKCDYCSQNAVVSGACGENLTWSFDFRTGVLVIDGEGAMWDFEIYEGYDKPIAPWADYKELITELDIKEGVSVIGEEAFSGCYMLKELKIPESVKEIEDKAFYACTGVETILGANGLERIGYGSFECCYDLENLFLSDSVIEIDEFAFSSCYDLASVDFGKNIQIIDRYAFSYCDELEEVIIPDGVKEIGESAFSYCENLKTIVLPDSIEFIGAFVFGGTAYYNDRDNWCNGDLYIGKHLIKSTESTEILDGTRTIADAFSNRTDLESIVIPDSVVSIGDWAFIWCENLTSVVIPGSVKVIGESAFAGCKNLTSIAVPEGVKVIGDSAFAWCEDLTSIAIPESVKDIDYGAFVECYNLTDVYYKGTQSQWNEINVDMDNECLLNATIHFISDCAHENQTSYPQQNATCTVVGYTAGVYCSDCESWISGHDVIASGHKWSEWNVNEATLVSDGKKTRSCSACGENEEVKLPKLEGEISEDRLSGIKIEYTDGAYDGEAIQVLVVEDFTGSKYLDKSYGKVASWNIKTLVDGYEVQPDTQVLVTMPIPSGFNKDAIVVYHIDSITGELEKIESATIEGDSIKFLTNSFSVYMIVDESSAIEEDPSENCSCNCHKSGFMGFIWKIINLFNKLFKNNKICACGVAHY